MLHSSNVAFGMNQTQLGGDLREAGIIELGIRQRRNSDSAPATPPHYVASENRARESESDKRIGRGLWHHVDVESVVLNGKLAGVNIREIRPTEVEGIESGRATSPID